MSSDPDGGLVSALERSGIGLVSGVPCSYLAEPIRQLEGHPRIRYVPAVNEGAALSVAAGAWFAGTHAAVLAQNSGFGNLINPLTSLVLPYRIPLLAVVSMRGWPKASAGEPQHRWMGQVVPAWLDSLGIAYRMATAGGPPLTELLDELRPSLDAREPAFLLVTKGSLGSGGSSVSSSDSSANGAVGEVESEAEAGLGAGYAPTRQDLVEAVLAEVEDEFVLATTGYLSRELYLRGDRDRNLYLQGSMGHVASVALGAALARPREGFVVLDGDGAFLMHLGAVTGVGHFAPGRFVHVVFDNGGYESTGGQSVAAASADLAQLAVAAGYRHVERVDRVAALRPAIAKALRWQGPGILLVRGVRSPVGGGRASEDLPVDVLAQRFRDAFQTGNGKPVTAALQVSDVYPKPWQHQPDLPLFATRQWQEIMAGRIEGAPHWFWTRQPEPGAADAERPPESGSDSASESAWHFGVGFAGTLVRDVDAYVWGNPAALTADPRSPLISEQAAARLTAFGTAAADLLPCLALTYPGYASFPVGSLAHDEGAVTRALTEIAEWASAQEFTTIALPYADGTSALAGIARRLGYHAVPITVESVLEVGPGGFAGHISRLPAPRRRKLAAERRHLEDAGVRGWLVPDVSEALFGRLVELRCNQRRKYDMPVDRPAEAARLARFLGALGERVTVFVVEVGSNAEPEQPPGADPAAVVAFSLFALDGDTWHAMYTGTDYADARSRNSYFEAIFYAPLDVAADLGVRRISYGHAADRAKLLRGSVTVPVECLLLGLTPAARTATRRVAAAWAGEGT